MQYRVKNNGRLMPIKLLPLVKPDMRISRIRLSCKLSSFPIPIPSDLSMCFYPVIACGKRECFDQWFLSCSRNPWLHRSYPASTLLRFPLTSGGRSDGPRQHCPHPPDLIRCAHLSRGYPAGSLYPLRSHSQVPRLFFPGALSPATPGDPRAALKCRFTDGCRLQQIWEIGRLLIV